MLGFDCFVVLGIGFFSPMGWGWLAGESIVVQSELGQQSLTLSRGLSLWGGHSGRGLLPNAFDVLNELHPNRVVIVRKLHAPAVTDAVHIGNLIQ